MLLTKIPIVIYYGDFIPKEQIANAGQDGWRARLEMARKWRDVLNQHSRSFARSRHQGEYAFSFFGFEQPASR